MLTNVVARQPGPRARATINHTLGPMNASLARARHGQQIRTFRFGMWYSHLDPELRRELRRRHRTFQQKYAEAISKRASERGSNLSQDPRAAFKRLFSRSWHPSEARWAWRFVSQDDVGGRRAYASAQSGQSSRFWGEYKNWKVQLDQMVDGWPSQPLNASQKRASHSSSKGQTTAEESAGSAPVEIDADYIVDPITNRKVPRTSYGSVDIASDIDTSTFKSYRSQFGGSASPSPSHYGTKQKPAHSNGPPPAEELSKYRSIEIDSVVPEDFSQSEVYPSMSSPPLVKDLLFSTPSVDHSLSHLPLEEDSLERAEELDKYQPYMHDDPAVDPQHTRAEQEDIAKYASYEVDPHVSIPEEQAPAYKDLGKYDRPYLHDEHTPEHNAKEPSEPAYDDLHRYGPYTHKEGTAAQTSAPKYDDLHKYQPYEYNEAVLQAPVEEPEVEDLSRYQPQVFDDVTEAASDEPFQQYGDLEKYKTFRDHASGIAPNPELEAVNECLKEFEDKQEERRVEPGHGTDIAEQLGQLSLESSEPVCVFDSTVHGVNAGNQKGKLTSREELEQSMEMHLQASDAADRDATAHIQEARSKMGSRDSSNADGERIMTGNFARDFPEEFSYPWTSQPVTETLESDRERTIQAEEKEHAESLDDTAPFSKLEPALERLLGMRGSDTSFKRQKFKNGSNLRARRRLRVGTDPDVYSREPQGLETSYAEECRDNGPTFVRSYGTLPQTDTQTAPKVEEPPAPDPIDEGRYLRDPEIDGRGFVEASNQPASEQPSEPTVYRILAYDPMMQNISVAETTSIVSDQAAPLTPAEVLLRLSNPTKFFPHFAPLQAEGFEIVSGGGDVLVFRKMRASMRKVNPIDLMGTTTALPNAAAFASPTGFINYDLPRVEETAADEPGFRPNSQVRREEPVFSGPKVTEPEMKRQRKKRSLGKRILLGGVWVAGLTYAMGVVAEFFVNAGPSTGRF